MDELLLTAEQALSCIPEGSVHTFVNPAGMLVGATWDHDQVVEFLTGADRVEVAGEMARHMKHGIAAYSNGRLVFFEHNEETLAALEKELTHG